MRVGFGIGGGVGRGCGRTIFAVNAATVCSISHSLFECEALLRERCCEIGVGAAFVVEICFKGRDAIDEERGVILDVGGIVTRCGTKLIGWRLRLGGGKSCRGWVCR